MDAVALKLDRLVAASLADSRRKAHQIAEVTAPNFCYNMRSFYIDLS